MLKTILVRASLLTALAALVAVTPAHAVGARVDVALVDRDSGETLRPILHDGEWWVAGRPGARYRVAITNRSGRRTLSVLSIDGVNAMSGETAAWDQSGYVLGPRDRTQIDGWRKNLEEVAAFSFADLPDSYAARTGRPANVGVIGIAIFDEFVPARQAAGAAEASNTLDAPRDRAESRSAPPAAPAPSVVPAPAQAVAPTSEALAKSSVPDARMAAERPRLGTAHGEIERSPIRWVTFNRARSAPDEVVTIHYDRLENLIAMGIVPRTSSPTGSDPFPGSHRYVPDPPPR